MVSSRYVDDVPYVRGFIPELSPAWLDFAALLWGFEPLDHDRNFAWCDLGCGQGVNAVVLAATHPAGQFHGVDFLAEHIDHARGLAKAAGAGNAVFHAADFGAGVDLDLPPLDYITAHGVYSWVDDQARGDLRRFIDRHLTPGGRVYISYNALPGRTPDIPFQRLMYELGSRSDGDSAERVRKAGAFASRLKAVNVQALADSPMANLLLSAAGQRSVSYLAHELMGSNWRPLNVLEVRAAMGEIGLTPAGSASLAENFDNFVLCKAARRLLDQVDDPDLSALVRDYLINQSFRRDVFVRAGTQIGEAARRRRLLATSFALSRPKRKVAFELETTAGRIAFDNPIARHMVDALASGPRRLGELVRPDINAGDLLANAMILAAARQIWPVESGLANVEAFNAAVFDRLGGPEELRLLALGCGTAVDLDPTLLAQLRDGDRISGKRFGGWSEHLAAHGVITASSGAPAM